MTQPFQGFAPQMQTQQLPVQGVPTQQFVQPQVQLHQQPPQPFSPQNPVQLPTMPQQGGYGQQPVRQFEFGAHMNAMPMGASYPPEIPLGAHILEVESLAAVVGYKGPKVNATFKVLQSNVEGEVGQRREWFRPMSGKSPHTAEIAEREFKALFVALLGFDAESEQLKAFESAGQLHLLMNEAVRTGQFGSVIGMPVRPVPGLIVRCDVTSGKSNPKGGYYLNRRFSPVKQG